MKLIKQTLLFLFLLSCSFYLFIGNYMTMLSSDNPKQNIQAVKTAALAAFPDKPILANLAAAQAILESNLRGTPSRLALLYNNLFGIKGTGTKGSVTMNTQEWQHGGMETVKAAFAFNKSFEDSFQQYKHLIFSLKRYENLQNATTFEEAANLIRKDGYATSPSYTRDLIAIYNEYLKN